MEIRTARLEDHDQLLCLWSAAGLKPSRADTPEALARKLERDPDLFLVVEEQGRIVASIMGSYDGRRGWINRLAVAPERRRRGVATRLLTLVEARLRARGCLKVNLLIEPDNAAVQAFYARLDYATKPLIFMERWL